MRRRFRSPQQLSNAAVQKLEHLARSPLQPIHEKLSGVIAEALSALEYNPARASGVEQLCTCITRIIERLPHTFGERFHVDACLIRAISEDIGAAARISGMVIPRYAARWGHERVLMPSEDQDRAHVIDLIHFPGQDQIQDVDLLEYPWLLHELVHCILARDDSSFAEPFSRKLNALLRSMRLASISDRGAARLNFQQRLVEIEQFWRPVPGHRNWAHELAIDVISLWLCGPSYLSAFNEVVSQPSINPFEIVQDHPPYAVRTWALLAAASDLGFASYGADLSTLERSWRKSRWDRKRDSRFLNLANRTLISECTQGAMEFCVHSNLRKCTSQALDRIRREVLSRASDAECTDDVGIDLVLLAWTVHREKGESAYEEWLTRQLRKLSLSLRQ